ncbi:MAG TPA: hypothetical protein VH113_00420 [Gemmatimonadales bacterium]|nr:hypothetical protein [Gemmatimonadales bacterium]
MLRVRFPAGLHIQPHYHLDNKIVQVLSGTMYFAPVVGTGPTETKTVAPTRP